MIALSISLRRYLRATGFYLSVSVLMCGSVFAVGNECSSPSIVLNAFDRNFAVQRDLRQEDIAVEIDRKPAKVVSLSLDARPRRIVLMVDVSGSMRPSPLSRGFYPAAAYAVDVIPPTASSALVSFSDKLRRESDGFEDRKAIGAKVVDLAKKDVHGGRTALFDSMEEVLVEFTELQFGDSIYVVTDGGDNRSKVHLSQLEQELIDRGVRVFVFKIDRKGPLSVDEVEGASEIEDIAKFTGGDIVEMESSADISRGERSQLSKLASRIVDQVEGVYRVNLDGSQFKATSRVKVNFAGRDRSRTPNVVYSRRVRACPVSQ